MATIELKADITGNVWKILKAVGDAVQEDEAVLIMESMKMEIPVGSTEAGVIEEVCVQEGQIVENGSVLARVKV
ncbi:MAG: acetyl-CoA carboxylase biotin carboxyl carrier protein subunit [Burkholderiales bacterium]|nr:acetyl-CoA carboxylase biotin carboxyl carrier protein subunit [Burkholderiales bacterium]MDE2159181.1 acetyl-CoA carboxylase biotin carboxyl carrier protein subunit [Burkholderiales bacterium]